MAVPNTNTFSLQDVVDEINPTTDDLVDCFADAVASSFDSTYSGSKDQLLNFRNYGSTTVVITNILFNSSIDRVQLTIDDNDTTNYFYWYVVEVFQNGSRLAGESGGTATSPYTLQYFSAASQSTYLGFQWIYGETYQVRVTKRFDGNAYPPIYSNTVDIFIPSP